MKARSRKIKSIDAFCGAGGATEGFEEKAAELGIEHVWVAINHWEIAVDTMKKNHPDVTTYRMDMATAIPSDLFSGQADFLWASPSCTHHSRAKGGKPRENQLRSQPELLYPWIDCARPKFIVIENVPEFVEWGPLNAKNMPIKKMKGAFFVHFIEGIRLRGYEVDWLVVNCADYGDVTTRNRLFIKAVRRGCGKLEWPQPTHAENPDTDLFGTKLKRWRAIDECLDFEDIGKSVFNRPKPLAEKTMLRIADGMRKYCGIDLRPFLVKMYGTGKSNSIDKPIPTITAGGEHYALCQPFLVKSNNNQTVESVDKPVSTIATKGAIRLITPFVVDNANGGIIRGSGEPLNTVTVKDQHMGVFPVLEDGRMIDIYIRMLKPSELAAAHSFPKDYVLTGNRGQQIKQIGNSVPVKTAAAMCESALRQLAHGRAA